MTSAMLVNFKKKVVTSKKLPLGETIAMAKFSSFFDSEKEVGRLDAPKTSDNEDETSDSILTSEKLPKFLEECFPTAAQCKTPNKCECTNKFDVFLSHRGGDQNNVRVQALKLQKAMQKIGLKPFADKTSLDWDGGHDKNIQEQIFSALQHSKIIVALIDMHFFESVYLPAELEWAIQNKIPVIPVFFFWARCRQFHIFSTLQGR